MAWLLDLAYPTVGSLRTEIDTQLGLGGLYVDAQVPGMFADDNITLRLSAPGVEAIEVPAHICDRSEGSFCVELEDDVGGQLRDRAAQWESAEAAPIVRFEPIIVPLAPEEVESIPLDPSPRPHPTPHPTPHPHAEEQTLARRIAVMSIGEKLQLANNGQRDARAILARERAGTIQAALIRNPRISVEELTAMARGPVLAPDAAEALAQHPTFGNSQQIVLALVRNARTPLPIAQQLVSRLQPTDLRTIAKGVGVRAQVAAAARKRLNE